jgi:hypothetical protein
MTKIKDKAKKKGVKLEYVEHPLEIARKALEEAATLEWEAGDRSWAGRFARLADCLPRRDPILKARA